MLDALSPGVSDGSDKGGHALVRSAMSDVLVAGNIGLLGPEAVDQLVEDHRLVVAHAAEQAALPIVCDKRTRAYEVAADHEGLARLFDIYSLDTVVYISGYADAGAGLPDEQGLLASVLRSAQQACVGKFVYLTGFIPAPDELQDDRLIQGEAFPGLSSQAIVLARQQQELCSCLLGPTDTSLVVIRLPFLAEPQAAGSFLASVFARIAAAEAVKLPFEAGASADLLSSRDLGALLCHVIEEPNDKGGRFEAASGYARTWGELAAALSALPGDEEAGTARVVCEDAFSSLPAPATSAYPVRLRKQYGWVPFDDALARLPELYASFKSLQVEGERPGLLERARSLAGRLGWFKYVELVVLFVAVQALDDMLGTNIYYRFVDARLLYVVLMGSMHGMRLGILAALLACGSMLLSYASQGTAFLTIVMRVENWLPFALYFLTGAICGYITDKKTSDIAFARGEYGLLYDKYQFLNEAYVSAIENKRLYKHQILGFEDSFGRIFSVVQKLDDVMPQKLYLKALEALEDVLHNRTVALYSIDQYQRFGRLMACSRPMRDVLAKSARLQDWPGVMDAVGQGGVWSNTALTAGVPAFACGSLIDGRLGMLVCVWKAEPDQLDMRFSNLLKVMCGLLEMSFRRAKDYAELAHETQCFPATDVLRSEPFDQAVQAQREMAQKGVAEYALLRFEGLTPEDAQARLVPYLRVTDEVGVGADGIIQVLLCQANPQALDAVRARLESAGLSFELVAG